MREQLVSAEKKDVEKTQAGILARRSLCGYLEHAYEQDIEEAERALEEFKNRNALFIQEVDSQSTEVSGNAKVLG